MKRLMWMLALTVGLTAASGARADYYTMGIASIPDGQVVFDGKGDFYFGTVSYATNPATYTQGGTSFAIGSISDPTTPSNYSAIGLTGYITGLFTIGSISPDALGGQSASVTTSSGAQFVINDGNGHDLTANLNFSSIETDGKSTSLNETTASVNLTDFSYSGSNQNLIDLTKHLDGGNLTVNFTFNPAMSLSSLDTTAASTTFSGTLIAAPAPPSCLLMLTGGLLSGLGYLRRRIFRLA